MVVQHMVVLFRNKSEKDDRLIDSFVNFGIDTSPLYLNSDFDNGGMSICDMLALNSAQKSVDAWSHGFIRNDSLWNIREDEVDKNVCAEGDNIKCKIFFYDPYYERQVKKIHWYNDAGDCIFIDYFTKEGFRISRGYLGKDGKEIEKNYYIDSNREAFVHMIDYDCVLWSEEGKVGYKYLYPFELIEKKLDADSLVLTDSEMIKQYLDWNVNGDFIPVALDLDEAKKIEDLLKSMYVYKKIFYFGKLEADNIFSEINQIGYISKHNDELRCTNKILVMTNSEDIEGIEYITDELNDFEINIGANTLMSPRLIKLGEKENVHLYPCINDEKYAELLDNCSFFLDINYYDEIRDAVENAFIHNMVLLGFNGMLHDTRYIAEECIFNKEKVENMISMIRTLHSNSTKFERAIKNQQDKSYKLWSKVDKE